MMMAFNKYYVNKIMRGCVCVCVRGYKNFMHTHVHYDIIFMRIFIINIFVYTRVYEYHFLEKFFTCCTSMRRNFMKKRYFNLSTIYTCV